MAATTSEVLAEALARIGRDDRLRKAMVEIIKKAEQVLPHEPNRSIRDDLTGPLVDALHRDVGHLRRRLRSGLTFEYLYRSKIARDFAMAAPARPDHVWEPQTTKLLLHLAKKARHVIVGGAYSGDQAVLIAHKLARQGGIVHCFEPNPDQRAMLETNAKLNGLDNIRINGVGLWRDANTRLRLVGDDSFAHPEVVNGHGDGGDSFPTTTIDAYADALGIDGIDLIMLDIEGAELAALQGAAVRLAQPKGKAPHVVFEIHRSFVDWSEGLDNTEIVRTLAGFGYRVYAVRDFQSNVPMNGRPIELVPTGDIHLEGPPHGFNMVAVKDEAMLTAAPFLMRPGVSPKLLAHKDPALHHPAGGL
ncbi:MAG: FkbM family methyltransferase [Dongiaceae bacterium]